ncbi:MAG: DUF2905 domain-containing protein [Candidatus Omnitrophica bacterium]|nr:DUF2905 domain-containing protein [Candidatus Omnitrophota bacterium]
MSEFSGLGKMLILFGLTMVVIGVLLVFMHKVPYLGKLPGDIYVQRKNFTFYFPIVTSVVLSIILSLVFCLFNRK